MKTASRNFVRPAKINPWMELGPASVATALALSLSMVTPATLQAVTGPAGYIYSTQLLGSGTQGCVAVGPGGTFVGVGPGYSANAQAILFVRESGVAQLAALGFNSISDCAYDSSTGALYVTDNGGEIAAALTGDTVFLIPNAASASALPAEELELAPADSLPFAANVVLDDTSHLFVSNSNGMGNGTVLRIDLPGGMSSTFATGFEFTAGLAFDATAGRILVAESTSGFQSQVRRFESTGTEVLPIFAGPTFGFGSYDLAYDKDGNVLVTGAFGGDVVALDSAGSPSSFIGGLNYATGISVNPITGRIEVLSSTFSGAPEDKSLHRFTPVSTLRSGGESGEGECLSETYGLEPALVPARMAICTDGDTCDADGKANGSCLFPIGFCLNVDDSNLPDCAFNTMITSVSIVSKPYSPALSTMSNQIQAALPLTGSNCFFSDGVIVPVVTTVAGSKPGKAKFKITVESSDMREDRDTVALVCNPVP